MTTEAKKYLIDNKQLMEEWDFEANQGLNPNNLTIGSRRKVWWICSEKHKYEQAIDKRTKRGQGCPYCSGHKTRKGLNDFETKYPEVAKEWHPIKNGNLKPSDVTFGSGKRVWWLCPIGHEYQATVHDRGTGGTNCPICNSSRLTSFGEQAIFYYIQKLFPETLNRYSKLFKTSMEFDIYIPSQKIAIEYDGSHWHRTNEEKQRELKKYNFCKDNGIILYRVKEQTKHEWENVADRIYYLKKVKRKDFSELEHVIFSIIKEINPSLVIDINIERDKNEIQKYLCQIKNSLLDKRPDVAAKWNFEKNGDLKPNMFSASSNEIVWWKCPGCNHSWKSSINGMTREGRFGCPICAKTHRGKTFTKGVVKKVGSLAESLPKLVKQWHPTKNGDLTPQDITAGRFKPVWWLCDKCGHEWKSSPNNRKKGVGCPCCSGRVPKIGVNDLETKFPDIAKEWDYEKNSPLTPKEFLPGSGKRVWWKCFKCGYSYQNKIVQKVKNNFCPGCRNKKEIQLKLI